MGRLDVWRAAKSAFANVLHYSGARSVIGTVRRVRSGGRRILILSYHRVVDDFTGAMQTSIPGLLISRETLRRQLEDIAASGYEFVTMERTLEVISGRRVAKKDLCLVTFDDGYRDVYQHGLPVLKHMGIPGIMYVPSGVIGTQKRFNHDHLHHLFLTLQRRSFRPLLAALPPECVGITDAVAKLQITPAQAVDVFLGCNSGALAATLVEALSAQLGGGPELVPEEGAAMSWDEVRDMANSGIEIGAHTVTHTVLPMEEPGRAEWEIRNSKAEIEQQLGRPCVDFAYCNGWYSDELVRMLTRAGFRSAVTTEDLPNRIGGDPFTLKRKVLWENFSVGFDGGYSSCLTGCQMDDVFTTLGGGTVVIGRKEQRGAGSKPIASIPMQPLPSGGL